MFLRLTMIILLFLLTIQNCLADNDDVYQDMSLEELFDVEIIVSASKRPEDLFEAPLSVTIIKQEQILQSGATSIPEALRLAPGLLVREQTPGNFDVHIRGFDDATTSFMLPLPTNSIMLVMIDNRVVYDYFAGGTFWETLPISINDIERIEIIRGPASALFGPNAAAGVINMITTHACQPGWNVYANTAFGNANTKNTNGSIGYNWNDRAALSITGNYAIRNRFDELYFTWKDQKYVSPDKLTSLMYLGKNEETGEQIQLYESLSAPRYNTKQALDKFGLNLFFSYHFTPTRTIETSLGRQNSTSQKSYYNNFSTPLSEYTSKSGYFDFKTKIDQFYGQFSLNLGRHGNNYFWNQYKYRTVDAILEYDFRIKNFILRPGISLRKAKYSSPLLVDEQNIEQPQNIPDEQKIITTKAFSLLFDYCFGTQFRFISGFRIDDYQMNDDLSLTYEIGLTYRLNKTNLFRSVYSKANRAPFMLDSYIGNHVTVPVWHDILEGVALTRFQANPDIDYLTNHTIEFGWRKKIGSSFKLDLEIFRASLNDLVQLEPTGFEVDTVSWPEPVFVQYLEYQNIEYYVPSQIGIALCIDWQVCKNLSLSAYGTYQKTRGKYDTKIMRALFSDIYQQAGLPFTEDDIDKMVQKQLKIKNESTPGFWGGFGLDYSPASKIKMNMNLYFTDKQTFSGLGIHEIYKYPLNSSLVLNLKMSWRILPELSFFLSARNLLGKHREYAFTDNLDTCYLIGLQLDNR